MRFSRRNCLSLLAGVPLFGQRTLPNFPVKSDGGPISSECGVGALMPWADSLWAVTYNSHTRRTGLGLGLYRIEEDLKGAMVHQHDGTYANHYMHGPSDQIFIGPYAIDLKGHFRFIEAVRDHRLTATMTHLTDPKGRVYMQTMEGLLYEVDVDTLKVNLVAAVVKKNNVKARPHFKGAYRGRGASSSPTTAFTNTAKSRPACSSGTGSTGTGSAANRIWNARAARIWDK